jgi:hypothetical protein
MNPPEKEKEILLIPKLDLSFNNLGSQNNKESVVINNFNKNLKGLKINQKEENKKLKNSFDPFVHRSKIIKNIKTKMNVTNEIKQKINTNLVEFLKKQKLTNVLNSKEIKQNIN